MPITILLMQRDGAYDRQVTIDYPGEAVVDDQTVTVAVNGEEILRPRSLFSPQPVRCFVVGRLGSGRRSLTARLYSLEFAQYPLMG
jgi:hypothetical protein